MVESGSVREVYKNMLHPYTIGLFNSLPKLEVEEDRLEPIKGMMPDPTNLPEGCAFCKRCPRAAEQCLKERPTMVQVGEDHYVACFHAANRED